MSSEIENVQVTPVVYSEWNKLVISSAESHKKPLNILKYGTALLITIISLIALWFSANWQTENVLSTIGIDITKWNNYLATADLGNADLISKIATFQLWNLKGAMLNEMGVQSLVAMGILSLVSIVPLLMFKNGTAWSIGSIVFSWVFLIVVIALFALGLVSQANALTEANNIVFADTAAVDNLNNVIADTKALLITGENLTPDQVAHNVKITALVDGYIADKDAILNDFMSTLKTYLNLF